MNLFVEAIPHDQRIGQGKPVRFHRMTFLRIAVQVGTCTEQRRTLREKQLPHSGVRRHLWENNMTRLDENGALNSQSGRLTRLDHRYRSCTHVDPFC